MIPDRPSGPARGTLQWTLPRARELLVVCAVLGLAQALGPVVNSALRYDRAALASGQWWRLWSAHVVHLGWDHFALNVAGLVGLWWLYVTQATRRQWIIVAFISAAFISAALYVANPEVQWYVGLSGVLHALWAAAALAMWRRSRTESIAALALLGAKLAWEYFVGPLSSGGNTALVVITAAHRYGAVAGLGCAAALRLWREPL